MPTRREILGYAAAMPVLGAAADAAPARANTALLQHVMARGRFVAYQPTALKAVNGVLSHADDASIRADLEALRPWFDGLITYGAQNGNERVPDIAARLGFHAVIVGVWDPADKNEVGNAIDAWRRNPKLVAGLSLGNEIVFGKRGTWDSLHSQLQAVRAEAPGLPLAIAEPFAEYTDFPEAKPVLAATDFMLANIHPVFEPWFKSATADNWTDFVVRVMARLEAIYCEAHPRQGDGRADGAGVRRLQSRYAARVLRSACETPEAVASRGLSPISRRSTSPGGRAISIRRRVRIPKKPIGACSRKRGSRKRS